MNANLSLIKAADDPSRFLIAAVLSPDDPAIDASDAALRVLLDEELRLSDAPGGLRIQRRLGRVQQAILTVKAKRRKGK